MLTSDGRYYMETQSGWRNKVQDFISQGFTVEVKNEFAKNFNQKYHVYKKTPAGDKVVVLDENGNTVAVQG